MNDYKKAIFEEMQIFAKDPNVLFLGQQCSSEDYYGSLKDIPIEKRKEMPVMEELQMGMSLGLALEGFLPISIFQRIDFLLRAADQLINHLDLIKELSREIFCPKIIIRTTVGSTSPLDTGIQHSKDLTDGFSKLLRNIKVMKVTTAKEVKEAYKFARETDKSSLIVEMQDLY